eukprot:ctg_941.g369
MQHHHQPGRQCAVHLGQLMLEPDVLGAALLEHRVGTQGDHMQRAGLVRVVLEGGRVGLLEWSRVAEHVRDVVLIENVEFVVGLTEESELGRHERLHQAAPAVPTWPVSVGIRQIGGQHEQMGVHGVQHVLHVQRADVGLTDVGPHTNGERAAHVAWRRVGGKVASVLSVDIVIILRVGKQVVQASGVHQRRLIIRCRVVVRRVHTLIVGNISCRIIVVQRPPFLGPRLGVHQRSDRRLVEGGLAHRRVPQIAIVLLHAAVDASRGQCLGAETGRIGAKAYRALQRQLPAEVVAPAPPRQNGSAREYPSGGYPVRAYSGARSGWSPTVADRHRTRRSSARSAHTAGRATMWPPGPAMRPWRIS